MVADKRLEPSLSQSQFESDTPCRQNRSSAPLMAIDHSPSSGTRSRKGFDRNYGSAIASQQPDIQATGDPFAGKEVYD